MNCLQSLQMIAIALLAFSPAVFAQQTESKQLPGTEPLTVEGDIASLMIDQLDQFLLEQLAKSREFRDSHLIKNGKPVSYVDWREEGRAELKTMIGLVDGRTELTSDTFHDPATRSNQLRSTSKPKIEIHNVSLQTIGDVRTELLLLIPSGNIKGYVVLATDADPFPKDITSLVGDDKIPEFAGRLAESGIAVVIPKLLDRTMVKRLGSNVELTNREFIHRSAFELGRHLIGYEVAAIQTAIDFCEFHRSSRKKDAKIGLIGWGEGAMLSLHAAAIDDRVDSMLISGHFDRRETIWQQPLDRNVFGLLTRFGDAELATMFDGDMTIEAARGIELKVNGTGGAPAELQTPEIDSVRDEFERANSLRARFELPAAKLIVRDNGKGKPLGEDTLMGFVRTLSVDIEELAEFDTPFELGPDPQEVAQKRLLRYYDRHNQELLVESPYLRAEFMKNLNTESLEKYNESVKPYREHFYEKTIGRYDLKLSEFNARTRVAYEKEKWTGYEVMLDVFPNVFAYGVLLLPNDIKPNEQRPVVVCQHGLEGRPTDTIEGDHYAYHDYAAKLAERGFIVFAPQNPYIFKDRFRTLQRKSNPMGKTLFSIIVPQHQQIVNWLKTQPNVDPKRIGFYGLSYGGKTAMRVPALVTDYCLSICSADFNDWVWKCATTRGKYTYVRTGEYEIFEFDLGSTFNYAEMAALICPRPFMVERGHFDGVAPDERVGLEYAKVRNLYAARLGIGDQTEIEWFVGPHTINGEGTFEFLHKHLDWPKPNR